MNKPVTITTPGGEELVLVPRTEYEALIARAGDDDAEDEGLSRLAEAEHAVMATDGTRGIPAGIAMEIAGGANALRVIREWVGLTQADLAERAETDQGTISNLEAGRRGTSAAVWRRIGKALDAPLDLLMPG
ncbi:MAG: helix-turn-helix transcriptional regulator [Bauldia sp.]|nr:helix-turn-helix transcriptional regulator [Bauldia sp.]